MARHGEGRRVAPVSGGSATNHSTPAVRTVLRWLPTQEPSGAFSGQHDRVHLVDRNGSRDLHARVSLWWAPTTLHIGDHVGPPRGGLVPGPSPDYGVAVPAGGYLVIRSGALAGWQQEAPQGVPVLRGDGEPFDHRNRRPIDPYFVQDYANLTVGTIAEALHEAGGQASRDEITAVMRAVTLNEAVTLCHCGGRTDGLSASDQAASLTPSRRWQLPADLVADATTLQVLAGESTADEAVALLWRLTRRLWDPIRTGRALAAETTATDAATVWPGAPLTEQVVAQIAAQALRWHGDGVVKRMPAWLLGWVMVARPVLQRLRTDQDALDEALLAVDRVRLARVEAQWRAMAAARELIGRASVVLAELDDPEAQVWQDLEAATTLVDVRRASVVEQAWSGRITAEMTLRDAVRRAYRCDARTWVDVFIENG